MKSRASNKGRVLGIDPGSRLCGFGVIEGDGTYVASGTLALTEGAPLALRLKELMEGLASVIRDYRPAEAAVEKVFYAKSVRSALTLGHTRGVALLAAAEAGLDVHEYSPSEIKLAVTGYGRADKTQVQEMVKRILSIKHALSADGADALAVALCHQHMADFAKRGAR